MVSDRIERVEARTAYGQDPESYQRGRPEYPDRVFDVLTGRCGLATDTRVLEDRPWYRPSHSTAAELGRRGHRGRAGSVLRGLPR